MFNTKQNKLKKKKKSQIIIYELTSHPFEGFSAGTFHNIVKSILKCSSCTTMFRVVCFSLPQWRFMAVSLRFLYRRIKMDTSPPCSVLLVLPVLGEWVFFFERIYFKLLYLYMRRNDDFTTFHRDIIKNSDITIGAVWYDEILNIMPYTILYRYRTLQYVQLNILFVCRGARNV